MSSPLAPSTAAARAALDRRLGPLIADYAVPGGHFDELLGDGRTPRPAWAEFAAHAGDLSGEHLTHAQSRVARQIHDNGVSYNVYAAADGLGRPWALDLLPLIVPSAEWESLARGLGQRARLLNAVAADLYGPQHLLREGFVPPALVFRHPGFLRECHGVKPAGGTFIHLVAFDLARGPDGRWRVVGTRAQAPSGAGYTLENRATIARFFPEAFRELGVQPLAPFVRTLQQTLIAGAPSGNDPPHVVLLTPGPYNETYFEHVYLAGQLGFPLVEGADLTVRDDHVYLKTVSGLRPVHAIFRRLDDDYCDPLELRADSTLGVPGLVGAWRAGHVLMANALGLSVLESPALLAFLPRICKRLFDETLETPALATWWCGEAAALTDARRRLARSVVKPAFPDAPLEPVFVSDLDASGQQAWDRRLSENPDAYVVEEFLPLSHAPVWHDGALESRALMLRVFLQADGRGDYVMMPGGLSRIAGEDRQVVSGQRGGGSKDTWVQSDAPVETTPHVAPGTGDGFGRSERTTSSRAGEQLFWLGRYAERSENCARMLRAVLCRIPDAKALRPGLQTSLVRSCRRHGLLGATQPSRRAVLAPAGSASALERALIAGLFDRQKCHSLAFNVEQTVGAASGVRDRLSSDNWRLLNRLFQSLAEHPVPEAGVDLDEALEVIDRSILSLVAVGGLEMAHMTRDHGWRFLSLGRHLERLWFLAATLEDVEAERGSEDPIVLEWLLDLSDSLITYRARHMRQPEWRPVGDLLVFDGHNPRSVLFQLEKLSKHVRLLPDADLIDVLDDVDRLRGACRQTDSGQGELIPLAPPGNGFMRACGRLALGLSDTLTLRYFSHVREQPRAT